MIDQSNRAGKLNVNGGKNFDGQNLLCIPPPVCTSLTATTTTRYNHLKQSRGLPQNQKKLHRRTNSTKTPVTAAAASAVVSRRSPLSYMTKGKSI